MLSLTLLLILVTDAVYCILVSGSEHYHLNVELQLQGRGQPELGGTYLFTMHET
ncbi:hypothetical protein M758_5G083600 [Ceratodon purpureus]|nr:hypothetical protein M758_5G083600 [Ceratodon purpureus]